MPSFRCELFDPRRRSVLCDSLIVLALMLRFSVALCQERLACLPSGSTLKNARLRVDEIVQVSLVVSNCAHECKRLVKGYVILALVESDRAYGMGERTFVGSLALISR